MTDSADLAPADPLALLKARKPREQRVAVIADDSVVEAADAASAALRTAERHAVDQPGADADEAVTEATRASNEAQAAVEAATVVFTFRALGARVWGELVDQHPPSKDQIAAAPYGGMFGGAPRWNPVTFRPAAIVASCAEPSLELAMVTGWFDDPAWNEGDLDALFEAALTVNLERRVTDWGKGSGSTLS